MVFTIEHRSRSVLFEIQSFGSSLYRMIASADCPVAFDAKFDAGKRASRSLQSYEH